MKSLRLLLLAASLAATQAGASLAGVIPIYTFHSSDGSHPVDIKFGPDGSLYGVASVGGAHGNGNVFRLVPPVSGSAWTFTVLYSFAGGTDGSEPSGLAIGDAGDIIGTTYKGGAGAACGQGCGVVFKLTPPAWDETILHAFSGPDGKWILDSPVIHKGSIYFANQYGGTGAGQGVVTRLKPPPSGHTNWKATDLYDFQGGSDGWNLWGSPVFGGKYIYGATSSGGSQGGWGTIYQLKPTGGGNDWVKTSIIELDGTKGSSPISPLLYRKGVIYGTASGGGSDPNGYGTVFKVTGNGVAWAQTVIHKFTGGDDGYRPLDIIFAPTGKAIYGITVLGGSALKGSIYKLTPHSETWEKSNVWLFTGGSDGAMPSALTFGPDGKLYGAAQEGGTGFGVIFRVD